MANTANTTNNTSTAFMVGIIMGAVSAMLLTPRRGQELRSEIRKRANEMRNKTRDTASKLEENVENKMDKVKNEFNSDQESPLL